MFVRRFSQTDTPWRHEDGHRGAIVANNYRLQWATTLRRMTVVTVVALFVVCAVRAVAPWDKMFPDFVHYWAAGKILASGQNIYDLGLQARVQQAYGWDKETTGLGIFDALPYYYP